MRDYYHAFVGKDVTQEPLHEGALSGLTFAVKDVFHVKNVKATAGNPDWLRTHKPAEKNAEVIDTLLKSGARLTGTTITDELMYSLNGENFHYGTPINPKAPERIPGGSSSGSAVAVAAELSDFALGTDTGGSIRIPAAYCGVFGFRPTHGAVSADGVIPLAASFDTVGWLAREPQTLLEIGKELLGDQPLETSPFQSIFFGGDAWSLADEESKKALSAAVNFFEKSFSCRWQEVSREGLDKWSDVFRTLQGLEIWRTHGEWIKEVEPVFGPDISERFQMAGALREEEWEPHSRLREEIKEQLTALLREGGLLVIPTAPGIAPKQRSSKAEMDKRRARTMQLTCIAGLGGLPQVTMPAAAVDDVPVGLSLIAAPGQDLALLQWVNEYWQEIVKG
ncbi:amidase [Evansella caseinilytica]|uniref:Amidase n=1 Tax=Evansella caseinilytica TaxID=1503961 RepID=A0A1H3HTK4_9BACI|nr:amidase [Evansella caseinilytica]SDY18762.1 amidase [Evansella caseinilytica]